MKATFTYLLATILTAISPLVCHGQESAYTKKDSPMKRTLTLMLLTLIVTSTFAQPLKIMRTDRLLTASGLPHYRKGKDINTPFIEAFRYGMSQEAKRWRTGYYEPNIPYVSTEKGRKKKGGGLRCLRKETGQDGRATTLLRPPLSRPTLFHSSIRLFIQPQGHSLCLSGTAMERKQETQEQEGHTLCPQDEGVRSHL